MEILLENETELATSRTLHLATAAMRHTVTYTITGGPTKVTVALDGSVDGETWFEQESHTASPQERSAGAAMFHSQDNLLLFIRVRLVELNGGSSPTVTVKYLGCMA